MLMLQTNQDIMDQCKVDTTNKKSVVNFLDNLLFFNNGFFIANIKKNVYT